MNPTLIKLINECAGTTPTRAQIDELLRSVGKPGTNRPEKEAAVRQLFAEIGHHGFNGVSGQSFHVADDLTDYEAY